MVKIVCLDPGHAVGNRNGSPCGTYFEWEFAQDVCSRAAEIIVRIPGLEYVMTKEADTSATLAERVMVAEDAGADLFLSQHTNAYGTGWTSPNGFGVYRYPGRNMTAARIGLKWCRELLPMNDRGIRERNFYVLREPSMPSILFETGFHTNREDVEKLKDSGFRDLAAMVLVQTSCEFLQVPYVESDDMAKYHIVVSGDRLGRIASANGMTEAELKSINAHLAPSWPDIYAEYGGDIVFLTEPNGLEEMLALDRRGYILCKMNTASQDEINRLEQQLKDERARGDTLAAIASQYKNMGIQAYHIVKGFID